MLGIAFLIFAIAFAGRTITNARSNAWAGPQTKNQRQRSQGNLQANGGKPRSLRQDLRHLREQTLATDWLESRRHDRAMAAKNGGSASPAATPAPPKARTIPGLARRVPAGATAAPNGNGTQTGGGSRPGAVPPPPAANGNGRSWRPGPIRQTPGKPTPPPPATSRTSQTSTSSGGTSTMASGNGGVEQLVQGYNTIYAEAMAGNIHAKHAAIKALTEGFVRGSQMLAMLARELSEPGHNFGPEVTEPLAKAAQHSQASSMATSESDAALASLLMMSVAELANSSRQAPHHNELSENGSR